MFVSQHTRRLFNKLCISEDFLTVDPELWASGDDDRRGCIIVNLLSVTNDNVECGVALVQELDKLITHDEGHNTVMLSHIRSTLSDGVSPSPRGGGVDRLGPSLNSPLVLILCI